MRAMTARSAVPILLLLALLAVACDRGGGSPSDVAHAAAANATQAELLPTFTDSLPDMDASGYRELLSQLRGTPVVVNVWGSWCVPCRAEAPDLAAAARRYGTKVQFVGIDVQDSRGGAVDFIHEFGWTYPSVFDPPRAIPTALGLLGTPDTLFYDRSGKLVDTVAGQLSADQLEQGIRAILR